MCQMPNIWHIYHTNHQKLSLSEIPNAIIFTTYKQCHCIFATVRTKMVYWIIFFYSLLSLLSLQFIIFSPLSPLFSLTDSLLSHVCHRQSSSPIHHRRSSSPILHRRSSSPISHRLHLASSSPISPGIVIVIIDRNRRGHQRWGEIGVLVMIVGIDVEVRWDLDRGSPVLVGLCWSECFLGLVWVDRGVFWVWVDRSASGLSWSVFCFAMDCGCGGRGGGGGGGDDDGSSVVVVIYCVRYIILMCRKYYFNI